MVCLRGPLWLRISLISPTQSNNPFMAYDLLLYFMKQREAIRHKPTPLSYTRAAQLTASLPGGCFLKSSLSKTTRDPIHPHHHLKGFAPSAEPSHSCIIHQFLSKGPFSSSYLDALVSFYKQTNVCWSHIPLYQLPHLLLPLIAKCSEELPISSLSYLHPFLHFQFQLLCLSEGLFPSPCPKYVFFS